MIRIRYPFPGQRPRRSGRNLLGALAGLVLLAFASVFALSIALLIGAAWGVARLLRPLRPAAVGAGSTAPSGDVLEGEFRVLRPAEPPVRGLPLR